MRRRIGSRYPLCSVYVPSISALNSCWFALNMTVYKYCLRVSRFHSRCGLGYYWESLVFCIVVLYLCFWMECLCWCVWRSWEVSYFRTMVCKDCPFFVFFLSFSCFRWIFWCCICTFRFVMSFSEKWLLRAMDCIVLHSVCRLSIVNGNECILVMWYRDAAILCVVGWFI